MRVEVSMLSLDEFAAKAQGPKEARDGCTVCNLPVSVLEVIYENEKRPRAVRHSRRTVAKWAAQESGTPVTHDMLYRHLNH